MPDPVPSPHYSRPPTDAEPALPRLLHADLTHVILGAFYAVHTELGCGFLEEVYKNAVTVLLRNAGLHVDREVPFDIEFHGHTISRYRADLIVESKVIVEVKAGEVHRGRPLRAAAELPPRDESAGWTAVQLLY